MVGKIIKNIRTSKNITLTKLSELTKIDIGHLSHIEKGDRNPSHKTLKAICNALKVPYQQLMYSYDQTMNENFENYGIINHIPYNKVLAVDNISGIIDVPSNISNSALAIKMKTKDMEPTIKINSYVHIEFNVPLNNNDIGVFCIDNKIIIRRFILKDEKIILKADNNSFDDIYIDESTKSFYIIGKVNS